MEGGGRKRASTLVDPRQTAEIVSVNCPCCKIVSVSKISIAVLLWGGGLSRRIMGKGMRERV